MTSDKTIRFAVLGIALACALALWFLSSQPGSSAAQGSPDRIWNDVNASSLVAPAGTQVIAPAKYRAVNIDTSVLQTKLALAASSHSHLFSTTKIRLVVTASRNNWSRVVELEAVGPGGQ